MFVLLRYIKKEFDIFAIVRCHFALQFLAVMIIV